MTEHDDQFWELADDEALAEVASGDLHPVQTPDGRRVLVTEDELGIIEEYRDTVGNPLGRQRYERRRAAHDADDA